MSERFNINNYNNVKVEKLGGDSLPSKQDDRDAQEQLKQVESERLIPVSVVTDDSDNDNDVDEDESTSGSDSGLETDTESLSFSEHSSDNSSVSTVPIENKHDDVLKGGKTPSDTDSVSSVSTTEILSKDPLFLVLSEFLMDDETGSNIVHVGNDIVKVLSKINSKLGRIADLLEKKHKKNKHRNDK